MDHLVSALGFTTFSYNFNPHTSEFSLHRNQEREDILIERSLGREALQLVCI